MAQFLIYMLKVAVLVTVLFLLYKLLLSKLTFHKFNRIVILVMLLLSFIVPAIRISLPEGMAGIIPMRLAENGTVDEVENVEVSVPIDVTPMPYDPVLEPEGMTEPLSLPASEPEHRHWNWILFLFVIYCLGAAYSIIKKVHSVKCIVSIINDGEYRNRLEECDIIESDNVNQPVNWMRYIVMPRSWLEMENKAVWQHESLHAHRWHSLDLLFADILGVVQWFNPIMGLVRRELELIHEFEADRFVIEGGTPANDYKMMLVGTLSANHGYAMSSWFLQSYLKNRIDMMERSESDRWSRLRALFVPIIIGLFLLVNATVATADRKEQDTDSGQFENHVVWVFDNGRAKVKLDGSESADMQLDDVLGYLRKHNRKNAMSRITIRYMYDIDGLSDVQPLAEKVCELGIKVSVTNNDEMLDNIYMPEYRCARIYDEGNGQYRFELNCHSSDENRRIRESGSRDIMDENGNVTGRALYGNTKYESPISDLSITGNLELMKKWIGMFDGHGVGIYPADMPYTDAEQMAQAAWKRGISQVSLIDDRTMSIILIPQGSEWSKVYPDEKARTVISDRETAIGWGYAAKGTSISYPRSLYNSDLQDFYITNVVKTPDELIIVYQAHQNSDLWLTGFNSMELVAGERRFRQTRYEGLEGFEHDLFWSPDDGKYVQSMHFEQVPDNVKVVDLYNKDVNATVIKGLQVSDDLSYYDSFRTIPMMNVVRLKTTHVNENDMDLVTIDRIDMSESETTVYLTMKIHEPRSFMGHVGSDFELTLYDGTKVKPIRYDGVPVDGDFDRNGDHSNTPFQIIFPPLPNNTFNYDGITLTGTVCHEPIRFTNIQNVEIANLRATLPDMLNHDNDYFFTHVVLYGNLKMLLKNINDTNLFGGDSPLCLTLDQRKEFLDKLAISDKDIDRLTSAQAYIIIFKKKSKVFILDEVHNRINISIPTDLDPYEFLKSRPDIKVEDDGNWYVYGNKAEIWTIE